MIGHSIFQFKFTLHSLFLSFLELSFPLKGFLRIMKIELFKSQYPLKPPLSRFADVYQEEILTTSTLR